jgi:N6-adenosine-specific RNA methylase IME4
MEDFFSMVRYVRSGAALVRQCADLMYAIGSLAHVPDLIECKRRAAALASYVSQRPNVWAEEHNAALKIRLRIEHRLGEVLAETIRPRGRNSSSSGQLPEEITRTESSRLQRLAELAWDSIEAMIDRDTSNNAKANKTKLIRLLCIARDRSINAELVRRCPPLAAVNGRFRTVVVDPPWPHTNDEMHCNMFATGERYETMTYTDIAALPISEKAAANAHAYLWVTNHNLPRAFEIFEGWGFRYVTLLTWVKTTIGVGKYFRNNTEHVLFGVKGSQNLLYANVRTSFYGRPYSKKHSSKPDAFYRLVRRCSPGPWLEVFARKRRPGWAAWGAEVNGDL